MGQQSYPHLLHLSSMSDINSKLECALQAALPVLLFTTGSVVDESSLSSTLQLYGGTDAEFAPPVGYMQKILLPTLRRLYGLEISDQV